MPKFVCNKFLIGQVVTAHIQLATVSDLYFLRRSGCCSHKGGKSSSTIIQKIFETISVFHM